MKTQTTRRLNQESAHRQERKAAELRREKWFGQVDTETRQRFKSADLDYRMGQAWGVR